MRRGAGLKPISDKRRKKLAAEGNPFPSSTFTRTPKKATAKKISDTGPDKATADLVADRDHHACVVHGGFLSGQRGVHWAIHHRKLRSQGVDNSPANLICVCNECHTNIHGAPEKARDAGWMLRRGDNPASVVMAHSQYGRVRLLNDGTVA